MVILDIEPAVRIAADPSLVVNGRALASEVGQRQQVSFGTNQTDGEVSTLHKYLLEYPRFRPRESIAKRLSRKQGDVPVRHCQS